MTRITTGLKFTGRVAPDDRRHQVLAENQTAENAGTVLAPHYVFIPGVGNVPQYAPTIVGAFIGYRPAQDCDGYYMSYRFQPNNNCYAYACNIASNSFAQPGRLHGYLYPEPPTGPGVQAGAEQDGLVYIGTSLDAVQSDTATGDGGQYVALLISDADTPNGWPGDYHWVRCDDLNQFRSWSQKDGNDHVTNFDFAGNPITDPASAN
jgi:hypothetical protein